MTDAETPTPTRHDLSNFNRCSFGDGGFYYPDRAFRAHCSCGWKSAASQDQKALVALHESHVRLEREAVS